MKSLGLCIGASNFSLSLLEKQDDTINILESKSFSHDGHPIQLIEKLYSDYKFKTIDNIAITGRKFRNIINASAISETVAIENAYSYYTEQYPDGYRLFNFP